MDVAGSARAGHRRAVRRLAVWHRVRVWVVACVAAWVGTWVASAALLVFSIPAASSAQEGVSLETRIEPAIRDRCPTAFAVQARWELYLAQSTPAPAHARITVTLSSADRFAASIALVRADGTTERELFGASCTEVLEASVLILAIALDPAVIDRELGEGSALTVETAEETVEAEATVRAEATVQAEATVELEAGEPPTGAVVETGDALASGRVERPATASESSGPRVSLIGSVGPASFLRLVPQFSFGASAELGLRIDLLELSLGFAWASETSRALSSTRGGVFALYEGTFRLGAVLAIDQLEVVPQLRVGAGAMTGRGYGVMRNLSAATAWVDVAGGLVLRILFDVAPRLRMGLSLGGEVVVPLILPDFVITGGETVFTPSDVGAVFSLAMVFLLQ